MRVTPRIQIVSAILLGVFIREIFAPFTGHPFDFEVWIRVGFYTALGQDPYRILQPVSNLSMPGSGPLPSIGYPPAWPFLLAGIYKIYSVIGVDNRFLYYFLLKQPMIFSDVIDGLLIYKIVRSFSEREKAFRALAFWLFCPYIIIISSIWGMFDQVILVFVLFSTVILSKTSTSAVSETVGILLKAIPLIYLPVFALLQKTKTKMFGYIVISVGVSLLLTLLPYITFTNWNIVSLLGTGTSTVHKIGNSMNYWVVLFAVSNFTPLSNQVYLAVDAFSYIWIPAVVAASAFCFSCLKHRPINARDVSLALLFVTLTFYLTRSQINEQYLIYFLGFGIIDYFLLAPKTRKRIFHAIWIVSLAYLVANNSFMVRFLDPLSTSYLNLDMSLSTGLAGDVRISIMLATGLIFSYLCALYLRSLYHDIRSLKGMVT